MTVNTTDNDSQATTSPLAEATYTVQTVKAENKVDINEENNISTATKVTASVSQPTQVHSVLQRPGTSTTGSVEVSHNQQNRDSDITVKKQIVCDASDEKVTDRDYSDIKPTGEKSTVQDKKGNSGTGMPKFLPVTGGESSV